MQIIFENIISELRADNIDLPIIYTKKNEKGPIRKHKTKTKYAELAVILMLLYIDDGAMIFERREDIERGAPIIYTTCEKFGLTVHIDQNNQKSKTEAVFFPLRKTLRLWNKQNKTLKQFRRNKKNFSPRRWFHRFCNTIYLPWFSYYA